MGGSVWSYENREALTERQLRHRLKKYAFPLFMKQAPDGNHLYSNGDIAEKVNKRYAKSLSKKVTLSAVCKWSLKKNEDGTTWKDCYNKALAKGLGTASYAKACASTPPKPAKVVPINSAKKNDQPPKTDTSPAMEIEAAVLVGQKIMADAQRRVGETSYVLDFIVKIINNDIASTLRKRREAGKEMLLDDIKKLFTTKGVKFVYDYWR